MKKILLTSITSLVFLFTACTKETNESIGTATSSETATDIEDKAACTIVATKATRFDKFSSASTWTTYNRRPLPTERVAQLVVSFNKKSTNTVAVKIKDHGNQMIYNMESIVVNASNKLTPGDYLFSTTRMESTIIDFFPFANIRIISGRIVGEMVDGRCQRVLYMKYELQGQIYDFNAIL